MTAVFGAVALAALALRFFLKFVLIDPDTGFYLLEGADPWPLIFNLLLAAGVVAAFLWVWKKRPALSGEGFVPCRIQAVGTILSGFLAEVWAILLVMEQLSAASVGDKIQLLSLLMAVLTIGTGLYLMNMGVGDLARKERRALSTAGACLLILWSVAFMLSVFLSYSVVAAISDHLLTTLTLVALVVFLVGHAKTRMGLADGRALAQLAAGGLLTGFFGLLASLPSLAASAAGVSSADGVPGMFQLLLLLALGLWGGCAGLSLLTKGGCCGK